MADRPSIDVSEFLGKQLEAASPDLLRELVRTFAEALVGAELTTSATPPTASAATSVSRAATATGTGRGTPGWAASSCGCRSCAPGPTFPTGCSAGAPALEQALISVTGWPDP